MCSSLVIIIFFSVMLFATSYRLNDWLVMHFSNFLSSKLWMIYMYLMLKNANEPSWKSPFFFHTTKGLKVKVHHSFGPNNWTKTVQTFFKISFVLQTESQADHCEWTTVEDKIIIKLESDVKQSKEFIFIYICCSKLLAPLRKVFFLIG